MLFDGVHMSYSAVILLPEDTSTSLDVIEQRLRAFFESSANSINRQARIIRNQDSVQYIRNDWFAWIAPLTRPSISSDDFHIAPQIQAKYPSISQNTRYTAKMEVSTSKDSSMEYFNDYALILEQLQTIPSILIYEEATNEIL
jgi:hypothetical protein